MTAVFYLGALLAILLLLWALGGAFGVIGGLFHFAVMAVLIGIAVTIVYLTRIRPQRRARGG